MFWAFPWVQSGCWRFWAVLWHSGAFCSIMMRSHVSERFLEVEDISWCFCFFWGILKCSHGFLAVLKASWKFRSVMLRCGVIRGVFVVSEGFFKVLKHYLTLWSALFCSQTFSRFLSSSERLLYINRHSMRFWGCSEASYDVFRVVLKPLWMFWGLVWRSDVFWHDLRRYGWFRVVLKHARTFHCILCIQQFIKVPDDSEALFDV